MKCDAREMDKWGRKTKNETRLKYGKKEPRSSPTALLW